MGGSSQGPESTTGPDGVSYHSIKAIRDTSLVHKLIEEIVVHLLRGVIAGCWKEMKIVFIPKLGRDLIAVMRW